MKPVFLYDEGINLWEQSKKSGDSSLATITILQRDIDSLTKIWTSFLPVLLSFFPYVFKWLTTGTAFSGSKVQELKLKKQLKEGFSEGDVLIRNESTGVYSLVKNEANDIKSLPLNSITHYRYVSLVFNSKNTSAQSILDCFNNSTNGISSENVNSIFSNANDIVLCRVFDDSETHAAMQLIGRVNQIEKIKSELNSAGFEQIDDEEVASFINS
ncbi:hypothetical protein [Fastidiosibacter lacustris]|uniref:hypothetical protein n=1 Tax=Fastidiosibacter lacustris TaxID=2056695 RepID=UPI000E3559B9|nr:hypothetical protein [Fastidiosibacter lacustris]